MYRVLTVNFRGVFFYNGMRQDLFVARKMGRMELFLDVKCIRPDPNFSGMDK